MLCFSIGSYGQIESSRMFIFGHSLIDHRPPTIPTPSNETTVPHWMYLISQHMGKEFAAGGQYGFLPQHANLPPISQWGYDIVPPVWESDTEPFVDANISHVLITAGNFMQWQGPSEEYPTDPGLTPVNATERIVDWLGEEQDSVRIYIYENWPDMAPYLSNGFPPSDSEFQNYNDFTQGEFHEWWVEYQDLLLSSRPNVNIRMIPVGPIIAKIFNDVIPNLMSVSDMYEDDAPHGRASVYCLAAIVTYMAIYESKPDVEFDPGPEVHPAINNNMASIVEFVWSELLKFNNAQGDSRVFYDNLTNVENLEFDKKCISVYPNPVTDYINVTGNISDYNIQIIDACGAVYASHLGLKHDVNLNVHSLPNGLYFIKTTHIETNSVCVQKILKQ